MKIEREQTYAVFESGVSRFPIIQEAGGHSVSEVIEVIQEAAWLFESIFEVVSHVSGRDETLVIHTIPGFVIFESGRLLLEAATFFGVQLKDGSHWDILVKEAAL